MLPWPFVLLAQVDKHVGRLNFVCNMLRPFLMLTSNILILNWVMLSLAYLLGSNPVLYFVFYFLILWNWNFKCVRQNACAVDPDLWSIITLVGFSSLSLKVAAVSQMKVAYLLAFKFNLTSRGLKTLPNKLADENWWSWQISVAM